MKIEENVFKRWAKKSSFEHEDWAQEFELLKLQLKNGKLKLSFELSEKNIGAIYSTLKKRLNDHQISVGGGDDFLSEALCSDEVLFEVSVLEENEVFCDFDSDLSEIQHFDTRRTQDLFGVDRRQANILNNQVFPNLLFMKAAGAIGISFDKLNELRKIHGLKPIKTKVRETAQALLI